MELLINQLDEWGIMASIKLFNNELTVRLTIGNSYIDKVYDLIEMRKNRISIQQMILDQAKELKGNK